MTVMEPHIRGVDLLQQVPYGAPHKWHPQARPVQRTISRYRVMSARQLFPILNQMRLDARPVVGSKKVPDGVYKNGNPKFRKEPIYGKSTFRNVIEDGKLV